VPRQPELFGPQVQRVPSSARAATPEDPDTRRTAPGRSACRVMVE